MRNVYDNCTTIYGWVTRSVREKLRQVWAASCGEIFQPFENLVGSFRQCTRYGDMLREQPAWGDILRLSHDMWRVIKSSHVIAKLVTVWQGLRSFTNDTKDVHLSFLYISIRAEIQSIPSFQVLCKPTECLQVNLPGPQVGRGFDPRVRHHLSKRFSDEIVSTIVFSLPLIRIGELSLTGESIGT